MGNSAQEHRVAIGLYAGRMTSSSWSPGTGAYKVNRSGRGPVISGLDWSTPLLLILTLMATTQLWHLLSASEIGDSSQHLSLSSLQGTLCSLEDAVSERTAGQIRALLLLLGNVERNPGPGPADSDDPLVSSLADLVGQAPPGMRDILCVWSPDKPSNVIA